MFKLTLALLTVTLRLCHAFRVAETVTVHNIDKYIDQYAKEQNAINTAGGFALTKIQGGTYGPVEVSDGVNIGVNTIYRTGDCTMQVYEDESSNLVVSVDFHLGNRLLALGFPSVKMNGDDMSGVFRVGRNSYRVGYTVVKGSEGCRVRIDGYGYEELADVESWTSLPEYDRTNLTSIFSEYVLPEYNKQILENSGNKFQSALSQFYCYNPDVNISDPETVLRFLLP